MPLSRRHLLSAAATGATFAGLSRLASAQPLQTPADVEGMSMSARSPVMAL